MAEARKEEDDTKISEGSKEFQWFEEFHPVEGAPWRVPGFRYRSGVFSLHSEIEQFYAYLMPTPIEHAARMETVQRIEAAALGLWPLAIVEVFGSFQTGMYLPNAAIDICVSGLWESPPLFTLSNKLTSLGIIDPDTVCISGPETQSMPLIRAVDVRTKINVHIRFNVESAIKVTEIIKNFKREFPVLPKLLIVLKHFILQRHLIETFDGGFTSYTLTLMVISFLQLHPRSLDFKQINLGVLLIEFFELYGRRFNYHAIGIDIANGGRYVRKVNFGTNSPLWVEDPLSHVNVIGPYSFNFASLKRALEVGYIMLAAACSPYESFATETQQKSMLLRIVRIDKELVEYRELIKKNNEQLVVLVPTPPVRIRKLTEIVEDYDTDSDDCVIVEKDSHNKNRSNPRHSGHHHRSNHRGGSKRRYHHYHHHHHRRHGNRSRRHH